MYVCECVRAFALSLHIVAAIDYGNWTILRCDCQIANRRCAKGRGVTVGKCDSQVPFPKKRRIHLSDGEISLPSPKHIYGLYLFVGYRAA